MFDLICSRFFDLVKILIEESYTVDYPITGVGKLVFLKNQSNPGNCKFIFAPNCSYQMEKYNTKEYIIDKHIYEQIFIKFREYIFRNLRLDDSMHYLKGPMLYLSELLEDSNHKTVSSLFRILLSYMTMNLTNAHEFIMEQESGFKMLSSLDLLKYKTMFYIIYKESIIHELAKYTNNIETVPDLVYTYCNLLRIKETIPNMLILLLIEGINTKAQEKLDEFFELTKEFYTAEDGSVDDASYRLICVLDNLSGINDK